MQPAPHALADLVARFDGPVVRAGDAGFDAARQVFNAMVDRRPLAIAYALGRDDVVRAVRWAADGGTPLAVRGGGHHGAGLGVCDGGLVLDLSTLNNIEIDPAARTVQVGGGCRWREVDAATAVHGLAVPGTIIGSTGVGGSTLAGGIGHLSRRHGLTVDHWLAAEVVLADGRVVQASAADHPDLFRALRGGGGDFGVVTRFTFRAQPVAEVAAGPMFWPLAQAAEVMHWYGGFIASAPEDLTGFLALMKVPPAASFPPALHGQTVCAIVWCHLGTPDEAARDLAAVRRAVPPLLDGVRRMPFATLQGSFDGLCTPGLQWTWCADFVRDLPAAAIARHVEFARQLPTAQSTMQLHPVNGAAGRAGAGQTAFAHRDATWAMVIVGASADPADAPRLRDWCRRYGQALRPFGAPRVAAGSDLHVERLAAVKRRYDPGHLFRIDQHIAAA